MDLDRDVVRGRFERAWRNTAGAVRAGKLRAGRPSAGRRRLRSKAGWVLLAGIPAAFLAAVFLYPLIRVLIVSFSGEAGGSTSPFLEMFGRPELRRAIWFTLWQASLSTVLTMVVGLPAAYVFARFDFWGKGLLRAMVTIPFVLPTVVVGSAFLALLGPNGVLGVDLQHTVWAILIAHVFYNYVIVVRTVGSFWTHLDPRLVEAARSLGASRLRAFVEVTLPLLKPALATAASLVFLFTFTSFGVILLLGGLSYATLEVEIWRQTMSFLNLPLSGALAVLQLVIVGGVLLAYARYQERQAVQQALRPAGETGRRPSSRSERLMVTGTLLSTAVFLGGPLLLLVERSFHTASGHGFTYYRSLAAAGERFFLAAPLTSVRNSLVFALIATAIAVVIGLIASTVIASRRGWLPRSLDLLVMLPLGTSAVTVGLGFIVAFAWPIDVRTSPLLIPLAHAVIAVPFVVRTAVPMLRSIKTGLREAAAVLGASPRRIWREIDLPLVARSVLVGAGFAFAISLGEFGATAFIARPDVPTVPIAIYRLLSRAGSINFGQAMALSVVLMFLTAGAIALIDRLRVREVGEF